LPRRLIDCRMACRSSTRR